MKHGTVLFLISLLNASHFLS